MMARVHSFDIVIIQSTDFQIGAEFTVRMWVKFDDLTGKVTVVAESGKMPMANQQSEQARQTRSNREQQMLSQCIPKKRRVRIDVLAEWMRSITQVGVERRNRGEERRTWPMW